MPILILLGFLIFIPLIIGLNVAIYAGVFWCLVTLVGFFTPVPQLPLYAYLLGGLVLTFLKPLVNVKYERS